MVYCGYTPGSWNLLQITCDPTYQDALSLSLSIYIYIYIYISGSLRNARSGSYVTASGSQGAS